MQSEGGAAGAVHGALQAGRARDDVHRVAGPAADDPQHVQDRGRADALHDARGGADARHARACRSSATTPTSWPAARPGFALLCSNSVQEAHDMAAVAHAATLETRIPFLHFFDGFRTSHEVAKIEELDRRRPARADRRVADLRASPARADARPPGASRHGPEPRRLLSGARGREPLLRRVPGDRRAHDADVRGVDGPPLRAVRVRRRPRRRARDRAHGIGRRNGARGRRAPGRRAARRSAC